MKKTFYNTSDKPVYKGPTLIMPGESRDVDAIYLNEAKPTEQASAAPLSLVEEVQALSVAKASDKLEELSTPDLNSLKALEESQEKPRSSLLGNITAELLNREAETEGLEDETPKDEDENAKGEDENSKGSDEEE